MDGTIKAIVKAAALGLVICLVILLYSTWTLLAGIEEMETKEGLSSFKGRFDEKQRVEGLKKLGLSPADFDKVVGIGAGLGGFIRKTDALAYKAMLHKHAYQLKAAMQDKDFAISAFKAELINHEYTWTGEVEDALFSLGLTSEMVERDSILKKALKTAIKDITKGE